MFIVKDLVTGSVVLATTDLVTAELFLGLIDTEPTSHEIVESSEPEAVITDGVAGE